MARGTAGRLPGSFVVISHDRRFLTRLSTKTWWLDRGSLHASDQRLCRLRGLERADPGRRGGGGRAARQAARGRDPLAAPRGHRPAQAQHGPAAPAARAARAAPPAHRPAGLRAAAAVARGRQRPAGDRGATAIAKRFGERPSSTGFSTRIMRGDRVGIIGPNGAGKTTLLKLLTGELAPDTGTVRLGTNLEIARFDQHRAQLDPEPDAVGDPVPDGGDRVAGAGPVAPRRGLPARLPVPRRAGAPAGARRCPAASATGCCWPRSWPQPRNLLVLDEPTNDLDIDTLDLLEEMLADYRRHAAAGQPRPRLPRPAGHLDHRVRGRRARRGICRRLQRLAAPAPGTRSPSGRRRPCARAAPIHVRAASTRSSSASWTACRSGWREPEAQIVQVEERLADAGLYARDPSGLRAVHRRAGTPARHELAALEERWLDLETQRETDSDAHRAPAARIAPTLGHGYVLREIWRGDIQPALQRITGRLDELSNHGSGSVRGPCHPDASPGRRGRRRRSRGEIAYIGQSLARTLVARSGCESSGAQSGDLIELFRRRPTALGFDRQGCGTDRRPRLALVVASIVVGARGGTWAAWSCRAILATLGLALAAAARLAPMPALRAALPIGLAGAAGTVDQCRLRVWQAPPTWHEALSFSPSVAASPSACCSAPPALAALAWPLVRLAEAAGDLSPALPVHQPVPASSAHLLADLGRAVGVGRWFGWYGEATFGRIVLLFLVNEIVLVGGAWLMDGRWTRSWRLRGLLSQRRVREPDASLASFGAGEAMAALPLLQLVLVPAMAAVALAGLWAQTFLLTGVALDAMRGRRPTYEASVRPLARGHAQGRRVQRRVHAPGAARRRYRRHACGAGPSCRPCRGVGDPGGARALSSGAGRSSRASTAAHRSSTGCVSMPPIRSATGAVSWSAAARHGADARSAHARPARFLFGLAIGAMAYAGVDLARTFGRSAPAIDSGCRPGDSMPWAACWAGS